ncbi:replication initiation factor domain-containing protein [Proteus sp. FZP2095]|uniref:replication initiation factor domain-containing protein n=1 Tax=Proteus sp. FZP2095 TaxID=2950158 RepID=UPI002033B44C|nr:replication initiation factor domain-containing protein [Proteus sp. FZP2095]MCM2366082.1 replication initiation factor domain-containing protein [Proteus sp. FZP2095]MCM2366096.1 replication initiation factor domain-containing protein [Proteus sp. FZP2095]
MPDMNEHAVFIDFLAFSAPISVMRDVHTFQEQGFLWEKFKSLPSYQRYKSEELVSYADIVDVPVSALSEEELNYYESKILSCYFSRLKTWLSSVFGLVMGAPRGKGGFAYQDSAILYSDESGSEHYGMVYWGGNNNTFYVQISGKGCAHVFNGITPKKVHKWLTHLDILTVKRLDLATDDYDGIYTCDSALQAYRDDAFYGGKGPKPKLETSLAIDSDGCPTKEIVNVGSRKSRVYWRIYNKALEQKVSGTWYRSEVELKEISVDVLLNISSIYTGLCAYSAQINTSKPQSMPRLLGRKAIDSIEAKVRWLRKQASANIAKVFHFFNGDINTVLSMIIREEHISDMKLKFDIPPIYQKLLNDKLKTNQCPF